MDAGAVERNLTGEVVMGRYRLGVRMAQGAMGAVYEAHHIAMGKRVAVKFINYDGPDKSEVLRRFQREATLTSHLADEHVVRVFDAGQDPQLGFFMVMERLEGEDLAARLARAGRLGERDACELGYQAAQGLEAAHAAKIIHRDLKPGNIFLMSTGDDEIFVKVIDFGVAKALGPSKDEIGSTLTRFGLAVGTPLYMSPEQAGGLDVLDERTDVYSLGAVLYEAIVGAAPLEGAETFQAMFLRLLKTPTHHVRDHVRGVDARLDALIADMLRVELSERIPSMRAVRTRLAEILGGHRASATFRHREDSTGPHSQPIVSARTSHPDLSGERDPDAGDAIEYFERPSRKFAVAATVADETIVGARPDDCESEAEIPIEVDAEEREDVRVFDRSSLKLVAAPPIKE